MTTKRIVYRRSDGIVEIVSPGLSRMAALMAEGKTEDEAIAIVQANAFSKLSDRGFGPPEDFEILEAAAIPETQPGNREFRDALEKPGMGPPVVNMPKARDIHGGRIASSQANEIARLKVEERKERLKGSTTQADQHAADIIALEALDLSTLATRIQAAAMPQALTAIWPVKVPR